MAKVEPIEVEQPVSTCGECKGTGEYRGLTAVDPCGACGGRGVVPFVPDFKKPDAYRMGANLVVEQDADSMYAAGRRLGEQVARERNEAAFQAAELKLEPGASVALPLGWQVQPPMRWQPCKHPPHFTFDSVAGGVSDVVVVISRSGFCTPAIYVETDGGCWVNLADGFELQPTDSWFWCHLPDGFAFAALPDIPAAYTIHRDPAQRS